MNDSNMIVEFDSRGGVSNTFITEVLAENLTRNKGEIGAGDVIMITSVAARLYGARPFSIPIDLDTTKYPDIPYSHIIGKFEGKISFTSLHLLGDFLLLKRLEDVDTMEDGFCVTTNHTDSVYEVVKKADSVKCDNFVLVKDRVATPIMLEGIQYYAVSFKDVVAGFDVNAGGYTVDDITTVYNHYLIAEDYQTEYATENGTVLKSSYVGLEEAEYLCEAYNEYRFRVVRSGQEEFEEGEIKTENKDTIEVNLLED